MTPGARTQAAIDLLDQIIAAARDQGAAADTLIARWFAERRYAGSKDRRAIRGLVYDAIRMLGERPASGRAAMLALAADRPELSDSFDGSPYGPSPIANDDPVAEPGPAPDWLVAAMAASGLELHELRALVERASLDVRVNTLLVDPAAVQAELGGEPLDFLPNALRLPTDTPVERSAAFLAGRAEVQDAGSQLVTLAAGVSPNMTVIDLCAGAGGKTLALAAAMENRGRLIACDIDRPRLSRLMPRAERAQVTIAETRLLNPGREADALNDVVGAADVVLVDAPCSGTGTWRRNPEARWRITPDRIARYAAAQAHVLDMAAPLVKDGGSILYIVCSLLDAEGAEQVEAFLSRHAGWNAARLALPRGRHHGLGMRLTPAADGTDGFFVAKLVRA